MNRVSLIRHQARERAVLCVRCHHVHTWNISAYCDGCLVKAALEAPQQRRVGVFRW